MRDAPIGSSVRRLRCETGDVSNEAAVPGEWTILNFSQSNPSGDGQGDVAAVLRRVADTLDGLGDVQVQDITFHSNVADGEDDLRVTVYYHRTPRRR
jgi:hypothetical protein